MLMSTNYVLSERLTLSKLFPVTLLLKTSPRR